jgi:hypothetical protein
MSKKRAVDYQFSYLHKNRPYICMEFLDKKNRVMMSSVDVLYHSEYLLSEEGEWDYKKLQGFMITR